MTASPSGDRVSYSSETSYGSCGVCSAFNSAIAASLASVLLYNYIVAYIMCSVTQGKAVYDLYACEINDQQAAHISECIRPSLRQCDR